MSAGNTMRGLFSGSLFLRIVCGAAVVLLLAGPAAQSQSKGQSQSQGQVITIDTRSGNPTASGANVDRRFAQIQPTSVPLPKGAMDARTKTALIRALIGEQGWAMRPFPKGHKGLTLIANGKLDPAGEAYLDMVTSNGLSVKPGNAVAITDIKFQHNKLVLSLNGGPDAKHRFLQHIEIGMGGPYTTPIVQDNPDEDPQGAHITLDFKGHLPPVTDAQVKALLAPLISFDMKTPVQAFTDTLPPMLKEAILNHHVMVGMTTDMVMFALGQPNQKIREMDGQMPYEEWIYGKPPETVQFVRINGNRVIRYEIAEVGKPLQIFTKDVVDPMMQASGTPIPPESHTRTIAMGDTHPNPDTSAPDAPPTLRNPGETLPQDDPHSDVGQGAMRPVEFPQQKPDEYPDASHLPRTPQPDETANPSGAKKPADSQQLQSQQPGQSQQDKPAQQKPADKQPAQTPPQQQPSPQ